MDVTIKHVQSYFAEICSNFLHLHLILQQTRSISGVTKLFKFWSGNENLEYFKFNKKINK